MSIDPIDTTVERKHWDRAEWVPASQLADIRRYLKYIDFLRERCGNLQAGLDERTNKIGRLQTELATVKAKLKEAKP